MLALTQIMTGISTISVSEIIYLFLWLFVFYKYISMIHLTVEILNFFRSKK